MMRLDSWSLHKWVSPIEKLADISSKVLLKHEFSSWVQSFVAVETKHEIVKDKQWDSRGYALINLLAGIDHDAISTFTITAGCTNGHIGLPISASIETLENHDE